MELETIYYFDVDSGDYNILERDYQGCIPIHSIKKVEIQKIGETSFNLFDYKDNIHKVVDGN